MNLKIGDYLIYLESDSNNFISELYIKKENFSYFIKIIDVQTDYGLILGNFKKEKELKKMIQFKLEWSNDKLISLISKNDNFNCYFNIKSNINDYLYLSLEFHVLQKFKTNYLKFNIDYNLKNPLDFAWVPHLRPNKYFIIGDHKFWAPAIILLKNSNSFTLIPDIKDVQKDRRYKLHLDFNCSEETVNHYVAYGFRNYRPKDHVMFYADSKLKTRFEPNKIFKLNFYIRISKTENAKSLVKDCSEFLWNQFGMFYFKDILPQTSLYGDLSEFSFKRLFNPKLFNIYQEYKRNNEIFGGFINRSWCGRSKSKYKIINEDQIKDLIAKPQFTSRAMRLLQEKLLNSKFWMNIIGKGSTIFSITNIKWFWNQAWFLNVRTAFGLKLLGLEKNIREFIEIPDKIINTCLIAPEYDGFIPSILIETKEGLRWINGVLGFNPMNEFNVVDCALTYIWLLKYSNKFNYRKKDILIKVKNFLNTIKKLQLNNGAIPTIIEIKEKKENSCSESSEKNHYEFISKPGLLYESSGSSVIGWLICEYMQFLKTDENELSYFVNDKTFLGELIKMAEKIADFISKEIIPQNKWFDFETFYSCTQYANAYKNKLKDPYTQILPQNNFSIYWTCEFFKELFKITNNSEYIEKGIFVLNYLTLFQQVWSPPFLNANLFGGFGCQNTDAEWSDTRQALFAITLTDYYLLTKNKIYLQRAISALKASYVLLLHENNKLVAEGNFRWYKETDYGVLFENYGHQGFDMPVPSIVTIDWGIGTANLAYTMIEEKFGDLFIDLEINYAIGINGVFVSKYSDIENDGFEFRISIIKFEQINEPIIVVYKNQNTKINKINISIKEIKEINKDSKGTINKKFKDEIYSVYFEVNSLKLGFNKIKLKLFGKNYHIII